MQLYADFQLGAGASAPLSLALFMSQLCTIRSSILSLLPRACLWLETRCPEPVEEVDSKYQDSYQNLSYLSLSEVAAEMGLRPAARYHSSLRVLQKWMPCNNTIL